MKIRVFCVSLGLFFTQHALGQIATANAKGVALGNLHLNVRDVDAQKQFWSLVGATPSANGKLMQLPGVFLVIRKQEPTGPSAGSVINHFGLLVKNLDDWRPKWSAAGITIQPNKNPSLRQLFIYSSDQVKVEVIEDKSIASAVEMHHIHLFVLDPSAAQAWYVKVFGAAPARRITPNGDYETASIPGAEFTFTKSAEQAPSRGRAIDDIGVEVKHLDDFVKDLTAAGIEIEAPVKANATDPHLRATHITDPWGTRFELTEGFPGGLALQVQRQALAARLGIARFAAITAPRLN